MVVFFAEDLRGGGFISSSSSSSSDNNSCFSELATAVKAHESNNNDNNNKKIALRQKEKTHHHKLPLDIPHPLQAIVPAGPERLGMYVGGEIAHGGRDALVEGAAERQVPAEAHARGADAAGAGGWITISESVLPIRRRVLSLGTCLPSRNSQSMSQDSSFGPKEEI